MCLGIPGLLVDREETDTEILTGLVEFAGIRRRVCLVCTPDAKPGDYVIVHAGIAISRLDAIEAARTLSFLDEIKETESWAPNFESGESDALRR
jgi:hydrogenase expression/formation protein HypC